MIPDEPAETGTDVQRGRLAGTLWFAARLNRSIARRLAGKRGDCGRRLWSALYLVALAAKLLDDREHDLYSRAGRLGMLRLEQFAPHRSGARQREEGEVDEIGARTNERMSSIMATTTIIWPANVSSSPGENSAD